MYLNLFLSSGSVTSSLVLFDFGLLLLSLFLEIKRKLVALLIVLCPVS